MLDKYKNFLVVAAHPDDDVLGCGGTIASLIKQKKKVKVVFVAEGTSCRFKNKKIFKKKIDNEIEVRNNCGKKALSDLGIKKFKFHNLKCGKLNSYPITEIAKIIENEISEFKPDVVITHSDNDVNLDHRTVY